MKQEAIERIKSIASAVGLSGYYSSLPTELREDEDIIKAVKEQRKEIK